MQKIKTKCLRAMARLRNSGFARKSVLALGALTLAAGEAMAASKGAAGFTKATQEVSSYSYHRQSWRRITTAIRFSKGYRNRWSSWAYGDDS